MPPWSMINPLHNWRSSPCRTLNQIAICSRGQNDHITCESFRVQDFCGTRPPTIAQYIPSIERLDYLPDVLVLPGVYNQ